VSRATEPAFAKVVRILKLTIDAREVCTVVGRLLGTLDLCRLKEWPTFLHDNPSGGSSLPVQEGEQPNTLVRAPERR
jgi:hypothetical protein